MKITIEPETKEDKKWIEKTEWDGVFEFAIIGRIKREKIFESTFSHIHVIDRCVLIGKLSELQERLRLEKPKDGR